MEIAPVTCERWADLAELFERKGPRGGTPMTVGCWCMWWRQRTGDGAKNKQNMRALVRDGREPGLLAYNDGGVPVGWVAVARREEYGQLLRSRAYAPRDDDTGVWSIVCFYVDPRAKRTGAVRALLEAAIDHAFANGATAIEAYPHERGDYMGSPRLFAEAGFKPLRIAGKRTLVRRSR